VALEPAALRTLLDALHYGVCVLDAEGRVQYANSTLKRLLGVGPEDIAGCLFPGSCAGLHSDLDWARAARNAIEHGRTLRLARHPLRPDLQVDCTLEPIRLGGGGRDGALVTLEDVTEEVQHETRRLRQAKTQAIANFGDSVAHEIRNPLNSIHMNVQLLREGLASADADLERLDRTAATVESEIKRLDRVVRDFVQYSRPPALRLAPGSINNVVRAALDVLDAQIREKGLTVEADLQSARPVRMDSDRLQRAIYNVLLNAVQVLPEGGRIECRSRDEVRRCLLEITDDGPGLELRDSSRIFDLFYTTKPGGTGLGLPIANRIVEEHGGQMAVASEPERGTTFAFFLPYEGPPPAREDRPAAVPRMQGRRSS
jgi:PAS domain S-box-containing protein